MTLAHDELASTAPPRLASIPAPARPPLRVSVAATFTCEPVKDSLEVHLDDGAQRVDVRFAAYNQVVQELLSPSGLLRGADAGCAVVCVRPEDWVRHAKIDARDTALDAAVEAFVDALRAASPPASRPLVLVLCAHAAEDARWGERLLAADARILAAAAALPDVRVVDARVLPEEAGVDAPFDPTRDRLAHVPFTPAYFAVLGGLIARAVNALTQPPVKVIVADADNTLWGGVAGELGAEGVALDAPYLGVQRLLLAQKRAGRLLCLASKNHEDDVWAVFERRPEMALARADVAAHRIDWNDKPSNLRALARELGLGLDAFVFVDDNPIECEAVRRALPEVIVAQVPAEPAEIAGALAHHWAFDVGRVTAEDERRTEMVIAGRAREHLRTVSGDVEAFVAALELEVQVASITQGDVPRVAQLTQRTNQLNARVARLDEAEVAARVDAPGAPMLAVRVRDRFGDYGLVGAIGLTLGDVAYVDTFLLSCRVLGRRVEHAMLRAVADEAARRGLDVELAIAAAPRNEPARQLYAALGVPAPSSAGPASARSDPATLRTRAAAATVRVAAAAEAGGEDEARPIEPRRPDAGARRDHLERVASWRGRAAFVLAAIAERRRPRPMLSSDYVAPRDPLSIRVAGLFAQLTGVDAVGVDDDFFDLGGDSLAAAELAACFEELGIPSDVSLSNVRRPTVACLVRAIETARTRIAPEKRATLVSLEAEAALSPDIAPRAGATSAAHPPRTILVTGATGYVGAYLLDELLAQTDAQVVCLARGPSALAAQARIEENLRKYALRGRDFAARVRVALGDLAAPQWGLGADGFAALAREVDAVVHNGAWVNFVFPYGHLRPTNVGGTETALRFALAEKTKPLHFVSTLGVLMAGYARDRVVVEDAELDKSEDLPNGYEQTKWVADKLVWKAIRRGVPASIYRLGMLSGAGASGAYAKLNEFLPSFVKGCIQLGVFPELDTKIEMVPVDFVASALVRIAREPRSLGRVFHLNHPDPLDSRAFVDTIRAFGYPLDVVGWDEWKGRVLSLRAELRKNALYPFLDLVRAVHAHQTRMPELDTANVRAALGDDAWRCASQTELLARYLRYFVDTGYIAPPPHRAASAT